SPGRPALPVGPASRMIPRPVPHCARRVLPQGGSAAHMSFASLQLDPRWRLPLLFTAILMIVVVPFLLVRMAEDGIRAAEARVAHTLEVEATVQLINAAVRNIEAATLERALGARTPILEERLDYSRTVVGPALDRLEQLTRDAPRQQVRVGILRQSISQRLDQVGRLQDDSGS